jgi:hypothetical protein
VVVVVAHTAVAMLGSAARGKARAWAPSES